MRLVGQSKRCNAISAAHHDKAVANDAKQGHQDVELGQRL